MSERALLLGSASLTHFVGVLRHKLYVFQAGREIGAPLWRLLVHDLSKFHPAEFPAYRDFYIAPGRRTKNRSFSERLFAFKRAWRRHYAVNPHHWEHWANLGSDIEPQPMPRAYVLEMVADWMGVGRSKGNTAAAYYRAHYDKIELHPETRRQVNELLGIREDV